MPSPSTHPSATPRSILKAATPEPPLRPRPVQVHHTSVRFPSSPKLSTVHPTFCSSSYDRTPITVLPNSCAMPERGCRNYSPGGTPASPQAVSGGMTWGKHVHPSLLTRAHSMPEYNTYEGSLLPPPLTSDDGSSEDSDGVASPPPETVAAHPHLGHNYHAYVPSQSHLHSDPLSHPPIPQYGYVSSVDAPTDYSLSFLPHAPPAVSSRKKDRTKVHQQSHRSKPSSTTFCSSWGESEESSCLGGF